jgi:hypothetical protein
MNVNVRTNECNCPNWRIRVPDDTQVNIKRAVCDSEFPKSVNQGRFLCSHTRGEI